MIFKWEIKVFQTNWDKKKPVRTESTECFRCWQWNLMNLLNMTRTSHDRTHCSAGRTEVTSHGCPWVISNESSHGNSKLSLTYIQEMTHESWHVSRSACIDEILCIRRNFPFTSFLFFLHSHSDTKVTGNSSKYWVIKELVVMLLLNINHESRFYSDTSELSHCVCWGHKWAELLNFFIFFSYSDSMYWGRKMLKLFV